jgi:transposase
MKQTSGPAKKPAEAVIKDIRRATRRQFFSEEKIRVVLEGLRGEDSIAELCRREGIAASMYYRWSKEFLEAGKKRLSGDTARAAGSAIAARTLCRKPKGARGLHDPSIVRAMLGSGSAGASG